MHHEIKKNEKVTFNYQLKNVVKEDDVKFLIDNGFTIEDIAFAGGAYIVISLVLLIIFKKTIEPVRLTN